MLFNKYFIKFYKTNLLFFFVLGFKIDETNGKDR